MIRYCGRRSPRFWLCRRRRARITSVFEDRGFCKQAVPSSIRVRRDEYREAGEWQQAEGDQRDRAAQKVFARAGSRKPRSDQHQECSTTDNHGYRGLDFAVGARPAISVVMAAGGLAQCDSRWRRWTRPWPGLKKAHPVRAADLRCPIQDARRRPCLKLKVPGRPSPVTAAAGNAAAVGKTQLPAKTGSVFTIAATGLPPRGFPAAFRQPKNATAGCHRPSHALPGRLPTKRLGCS
jgi:hypothetical protein